MLFAASLVIMRALRSASRRSMLPPAAALPWLRDPFAPDDPLRELMAGRLMAQLEREAAALAVMASLAVVVVHLPVKLAAPQLYPLRFPAGGDSCLCMRGLLLSQAVPCSWQHGDPTLRLPPEPILPLPAADSFKFCCSTQLCFCAVQWRVSLRCQPICC